MSSDSDQCRLRTDYEDRRIDSLSVNDILRNRAEAIGDEPYLYYGPEKTSLTYAEVNETANSIANTLISWGVEPDDNVGVMMENPLKTVLVMFGIYRAGAVYCPVNYRYKGDVFAYQVNDTIPELLFLESKYTGRLNDIKDDLETTPSVVLCDTDTETEPEPLADAFDAFDYDTAVEGETTDPGIERSWDDNACMVYTSGTTGKPKGCMWAHRVLLYNLSLFFAQALDSGDVAHNPLPLYHIGGLGPTIYLMIAGGGVALWDQFSPNDFWERVDRYGATYTVLVSVMIDWLRKQPERESDPENTLKMVSMQPLPEDLISFAERFAFDFVPVGYGQTESGTPVSGLIHAARGSDATPEAYQRGSDVEDVLGAAERLEYPILDEFPEAGFIGKPVPCKAEATVLDEHDEELPPGEVGELALRPTRPKVFMNGYYGAPEQTVEANTTLWFHTGDAAYRDEDGNYYFVDRMEGLIRRRGENISSIQIEEQLIKHDAVSQTTVFPVPAQEGGEDEIAAAIELEPDRNVTEEELAEFLEDKLPEFMYPRHYIVRESLPTTATNKIETYKVRAQFLTENPELSTGE